MEPTSETRCIPFASTNDDLSRDVYCILGVPIDAIDLSSVVRKIKIAAQLSTPYLISTPNLHFLVNSLTSQEFRESLLQSDICPADGAPIIWMARLLGLPLKKRVAGADIFEALKLCESGQPLKIFLFGGSEAIAQAAFRRINSAMWGVKCVGWLCPGFGGLDTLSNAEYFEKINASGADFLMAALGAKNGQLWLLRYHTQLQIPVRAHLGATLNFVAGSVQRAPLIFRNFGMEWLWRIKEEPSLFRRYWHDGTVFLWLLGACIVPLAIRLRWLGFRGRQKRHDFDIVAVQKDDQVTVSLSGYATSARVADAIGRLREAVTGASRLLVVDLSQARAVDARFLGLFLMLRKQLRTTQCALEFRGASNKLQRWFRLNAVEHLLTSEDR